jgi:hypothetical protein
MIKPPTLLEAERKLMLRNGLERRTTLPLDTGERLFGKRMFRNLLERTRLRALLRRITK